MDQDRKRFRKNENSNGREETSDTPLSKGGQELVQIIPTLVSEIFLEELRDARLLKTCRLVCKSWNIAAIKSLRTCSVVSINENSSKLKHFAALLRKYDSSSFQHFPSPFRNVQVETRSFTEPTFINLVFTPSLTCTSLTVVLPEKDDVDLDQSQLSLFLATNKDSITDLTITANINPGFQLNEALVNDALLRLSSLKSLKFTDYSRRCPHILFVQNILRVCRPTYLDLNIRDYRSLPSLLLPDQVTHIKDLHLFCGKYTGNVLTHLANTRFHLRSLSVFEHGFDYNQYLQEWYSFLENVSPSLMDFRTNLPIGSKIRFANLKELHIQNNNVLSTFTPNNFPSLTKIIFNVEEPIYPAGENFTVPHKGVQYFVIETQNMPPSRDEDYDVFMLLTFVSRQFPKVTSLDFSISGFPSSTLTDICKAFPNLKVLILNGGCNFFSFAGFTTSSLNHSLNFEMIPRRGSILDLKKLEIIKFGSEFCVSPDMIRHCLPRVRKLKQIELHWSIFDAILQNSSLSAPLFRDFLGHLDKIIIWGSHSFAAKMARVQKMLPSSVLIYEGAASFH